MTKQAKQVFYVQDPFDERWLVVLHEKTIGVNIEDGPHRKKLRTYLGIVVVNKVDVTYDNWKQVLAAQKDLIWEDIQVF